MLQRSERQSRKSTVNYFGHTSKAADVPVYIADCRKGLPHFICLIRNV